MGPVEILEALLALADEVSLPVRVLNPGGDRDGEFTPVSALCRIRGAAHVVLAAQDPVEFQSQVLARALHSEASERLEGRFLAPAIRELLEQAAVDDPRVG